MTKSKFPKTVFYEDYTDTVPNSMKGIIIVNCILLLDEKAC